MPVSKQSLLVWLPNLIISVPVSPYVIFRSISFPLDNIFIFSFLSLFSLVDCRRVQASFWKASSGMKPTAVSNNSHDAEQKRTTEKERGRKIPVVIVVVIVRQNNSLRICAEISAINIQTKQMP